jgi:flavin-dependent dehydrogenase
LAYFLAKQVEPKLKILLLERKTFPRVKCCGDAWCAPALDILEEMEWEAGGNSVLEELEQRGLCRPVQRGGFISPFGHQCINQGDAVYGSSKNVRTYAMKRVVADEYLARAAAKVGVDLQENCEARIKQVEFHAGDKQYWSVPCQTDKSLEQVVYQGRVLVAADGATSYLATHLGLVSTQADATCSHRYVRGHSHNWTHADGVMFFNRAVLPGYSAIFRHYNNDMYLGTYILPGGKATSRCLASFEDELVQRHPYVRQAFGEKSVAETEWCVGEGETGRLQSAPIRCGGEEKTYANHFLVVGDAAGQTDPLTGEGIHTAMIAAKLAAQTLQQMFQRKDFSECKASGYQKLWKQSLGRDFWWSAAGARIIYELPIVLDAACAYGRDKGQDFLDEFGLIMTGVKPKSTFLNPSLSIPIMWYLLKEIFWQYIWRCQPLIPPDIGAAVVARHGKKKV